MNARDDGGPANPAPALGERNFADPAVYTGISIRDLFACFGMLGELMTACLSQDNAQALADAAEAAGRGVEAQVAFNAFSLADAMLEERAR